MFGFILIFSIGKFVPTSHFLQGQNEELVGLSGRDRDRFLKRGRVYRCQQEGNASLGRMTMHDTNTPSLSVGLSKLL